MIIKAPKWCSYAEPTVKGWVHPKTGELLKAQKFTKKQVSDWKDAVSGVADKHAIAEVAETHDEMDEIVELEEVDFEDDFEEEEV